MSGPWWPGHYAPFAPGWSAVSAGTVIPRRRKLIVGYPEPVVEIAHGAAASDLRPLVAAVESGVTLHASAGRR